MILSRRNSSKHTINKKRNEKITEISNKKTKKQIGGVGKWPYIPLDLVNKLEPLAAYYNVSHKARGLQKPTKSDKGFLEVYRNAKGKPERFENLPVRAAKPDGEKWAHHREDFCNRRYAMIKGTKGYSLYDEKTGLPSVMHVNMLMWACSPDERNIQKNWKSILAKLNNLKDEK